MPSHVTDRSVVEGGKAGWWASATSNGCAEPKDYACRRVSEKPHGVGFRRDYRRWRHIAITCGRGTSWPMQCLNREQLWTLTEARVVVGDFRQKYNQVRPHSRLGYVSPAMFAAQLCPSPAHRLTLSVAQKDESGHPEAGLESPALQARMKVATAPPRPTQQQTPLLGIPTR